MQTLSNCGADGIPAELTKYFHSLTENASWVLRRIETVDIIDSNILRRTTSFDIDVSSVAKRATIAGLNPEQLTWADGKLPVPLGIESKGLHLSLDIRGPAGEVLQLLPSGIDSIASYASVVNWIDESRYAGHPSMCEIKALLLATARHHFSSSDEYDMEQFLSGETDFLPAWGVPDNDLLQSGLFRVLTWDGEFFDLLLDLTLRCRPIVLVDPNSAVTTVKVSKLEPSRHPTAPVFGWSAGELTLEDSGLGSGTSSHLRILAPDGTEFSSAHVLGWGFERYRRSIQTDRVLLHAAKDDFPLDERTVKVRLWPQARGFVSSSLWTCAVAIIILSAMLWKFSYVARFANAQSEILFGALLALPSIYTVFLSRSNEHDVRSAMLAGRRRALYVVALSHTIVLFSMLVHERYPSLLKTSMWVSLVLTLITFGVIGIGVLRHRAGVAGRNFGSEFPDQTWTIPFRLSEVDPRNLY